MNYQLTCVCGHRFLIQEDQLSHTVGCPACKRALMPVASPTGADAAHGPAATGPSAVAAPADPTKRCPFCGEVILAIAKKCKHCGEFLDRAAAPSAAGGSSSSGSNPANAMQAAAAAGGGAVPTTASTDPPPVYTLTVSQWDNFWRFLICMCLAVLGGAAFLYIDALRPYTRMGVPAVLIVAASTMWIFFLSTRNSRCFVRPMRIDTETGILSKDLNSIELFRISDMELKQGLLERVLRIGTIKIFSNDATTPELILYQIPKAREVYKYLQNQIPLAAKQRGALYMEK